MYQIGLEKDELDTPALLIDLDLMEENISTMADFFRGKEAALRAHTKVHRTPILAHKQMEAGAKGVCCQKVGEAEVMVASGIRDVMVTNEIVAPAKIRRLVSLAKHADISVPVDDASNAKALARAVKGEGVELSVLVDIHMGSGRCGVEPGEPALRLARSIQELKGLRLRGLMGFEGHVSAMEPREKRRVEIERLEGLLIETKELMERDGMEVPEVSTGSTGTYDVSGRIPGVTEVQAGTYILMDANYHQHVPEFGCALSVLSTVISRPSSDRAITDAGRMSISTPRGTPLVKGMDGLEVVGVHAENTILRVEGHADAAIGDKIEIIPPYLDGTVKLHERFHGIRNGRVEAAWEIIGRDSSN
ncbi:hypothetical protein AC482_04395 [miscellaneous Crenarchaeota group-15 archaeon DG-45]|uniref:D-serine dehydratase-like domain-containing protein n=1 Tax=miscellaneous Crenarchaeota group-15 archaeon DG-45 TaxID=1685127 RepID=A0A0M0BPH9_9ARCH|nr:MAG: hypothetical protein AC482_04395 [miscellaneous Crenarchaeota group-15 archaeon DG-45]